MTKFRVLISGLILSFCANSANAALISTFEDAGLVAADIQDTVDNFRNALGPNNGNAPVNGDPLGRRQIDWDALPDAISDPTLFPGDFFNGDSAPRARGIEFNPTGTTTGFLVSSTEASGVPVAFGFDQFLPRFSDERLFTSIGGSSFDINFFDPSDQTTQATVRGFGAVFSGLDFADTVQMQFLNLADELIGSINPLGTSEFDLNFAGAIFDSAEIATVRILGGNRFLESNGNFGGGSGDGFAFDDFIFGEPIAVEVSEPSAFSLLPLCLLGALVARKRKAPVKKTYC